MFIIIACFILNDVLNPKGKHYGKAEKTLTQYIYIYLCYIQSSVPAA